MGCLRQHPSQVGSDRSPVQPSERRLEPPDYPRSAHLEQSIVVQVHHPEWKHCDSKPLRIPQHYKLERRDDQLSVRWQQRRNALHGVRGQSELHHAVVPTTPRGGLADAEGVNGDRANKIVPLRDVLETYGISLQDPAKLLLCVPYCP